MVKYIFITRALGDHKPLPTCPIIILLMSFVMKNPLKKFLGPEGDLDYNPNVQSTINNIY